MKKLSFFLLFFLSAIGLFAQQGTVASGGNAGNNSGSISYSLGQIDYVAEANSTGAINAGVQQPYEIFISSTHESFTDWRIDLFPNPTAHTLNIRIPELKENLRYQLIDMNGRILAEAAVLNSISSVSMQEFPAAVYFLQLFDAEKSIKSFKIIKN